MTPRSSIDPPRRVSRGFPRRPWHPIILPSRGDGGRLPAALVLVLVGLAAVQLVLPNHIDLPPGGAVARVALGTVPAAPPVVLVPQLPAGGDAFAPRIARTGAAGPTDPLGGAMIAGVVQQGRLRVAVVQLPGAPLPGGRLPAGKLRYVGVGGVIAGWRLAALDQGEARLTRAGQTLQVAYGTHAVAPLVIPTAIGPVGRAGPAGRAMSPQNFESGL